MKNNLDGETNWTHAESLCEDWQGGRLNPEPLSNDD
jgi:hypothetical protein